MDQKYYAVKSGRIPGIYKSWDDCKKQTDGFSSAIYKSFKTKEEIYQLVRKRTAYTREELEKISRKESLVILFKHYITFEKPIDLEYLKKTGIIKGNIQSPRSIENKSIVDILNYSKKDYSKIEIS